MVLNFLNNGRLLTCFPIIPALEVVTDVGVIGPAIGIPV